MMLADPAFGSGGASPGRGLTDEQVEDAVQRALEELPEQFRSRMGDVAVLVEDSHPAGLMGIYDPRGGIERIVIFRDGNPNVAEVRKTVLHEVGHFFGMDEEALRRAGYG